LFALLLLLLLLLQVKAPDMPGMSLRGVVKCLMSQCQSMGVRVVERPEDA
jgi:ribosomal protein L11